MKASELRIGNLVYNRQGDIHAIGCNCFHRFRYPSMDGNPSGFKPIPLTEEILLKCGFEKDDFSKTYIRYSIGCFNIIHDTDKLSFICDGVKYMLVYVEHLHQLQNLYFSLTQTELEVYL